MIIIRYTLFIQCSCEICDDIHRRYNTSHADYSFRTSTASHQTILHYFGHSPIQHRNIVEPAVLTCIMCTVCIFAGYDNRLVLKQIDAMYMNIFE